MKNKKLVSAILLLIILPCFVLPASANSAQWHWSGVDAAGVIITDGDSPIVVENELLTFDLSEFPSNHYREAEDFLAYSGKVTAEYTFYNPSDMTVTATLAFPFGSLPDYAYGLDDSDGKKYGVKVNGEPIDTEIRHTLRDPNTQFNLDTDLPLLSDEYISTDFYTPDMTVTKYSWKLDYTIDSGEKLKNPTFACDIGQSEGKRVFYFPVESCGHVQKDKEYRIGTGVGRGNPVIYVIGEPLEELPEWKLYRDGGCKDGDELRAEFRFFESETMTLLDFTLENRPEDSPVSEMDWYNASISELILGSRYTDYPIVSLYGYSGNFSKYLMRWYQYDITLEPGERIVNTVTAPMYPTIDMSYTPTIFEYTYLLSPASTWTDFGDLKILINTPYYLTECSLSGFEKTEDGYQLIRSGLPTDENGKSTDLTFTLSTEENPVPDSQTPSGIMTDIAYFFLFYGPIIMIGAAAGVLLILLFFIFKRIFRR